MKKKTSVSSLSIMFPFLNDWGTVGSLVSLAVQTAQQFTDDWEVVLIDDGSTEENKEALRMIVQMLSSSRATERSVAIPSRLPRRASLAPRNDADSQRIRIVHHQKNRGYGGALRSGFDHCTKEWIFYTDCDAQYDPRELADLIRAVKPHTGMVNGYKIKRHDPWYRTVMGRLYHHTVKVAFQLPIRDTDCDFRLIRRSVFEKVRLFESTGTICVELVKKVDHAGFPIIEVPVHHFWRTSGKSQFFNFPRLYKTATNLGRLWWKLMAQNNYST